jgi:ABC-type antimicrobial peptide transport system ATPase subunit
MGQPVLACCNFLPKAEQLRDFALEHGFGGVDWTFNLKNFPETPAAENALARAIAMEPAILLYDEPTTGLDPVMANVINELIVTMREKLDVTSIAITHDMNSAYRIADRIAMLYMGEIIEVGTPDQIQKSQNPIVQQFIQGDVEGPITRGADFGGQIFQPFRR